KFSETVENFHDKRNQEEVRYLDSLSNTRIDGENGKKENLKVFNIGIAKYSYDEVKENALNLGLDLKGGLNVILQVSVKDILLGLADQSTNPIFRKALDDASELQKNSQNTYLEDFYTAFDKIKGDTKLASPEIFATRSLYPDIDINMTDDQVKSVISQKIDESVESAFRVLRERIDQFGVTSPNIQRLGNSGRMLVELPGVKDTERATDLITKTAQLQFWDAYKGEEFISFLLEANETLKPIVNPEVEQDTTATETTEADQISQLLGEESTDSTKVGENPILDLVKGPGQQGGPVVALFDAGDMDKLMGYLKMPQVRALIPAEKRNVKFLFGKPNTDTDLVELYALVGNREDVPPLSGAVVTDARQEYDEYNKPAVSMQMDSKGAKIWEQMTEKAFTQSSQIAIVLDSTVYSAPGVTTGKISGGNSRITGNFTLNEATDLANVLRAGKLPARADIIQSEVVGPSLGQEAISSGKTSFLIALTLVLIWMVFYYGKAGLFADFAMLFNILLIFGILSGLGAALTLPGIAGIVLTIGMAVDANVIIFERIREELLKGKGQKEAIKDGFQNALSSILDANITTGLTAIILFVFGSGPIKGFATTLLIGIGTSLFTAIFITRLLVDWYINKKKNLDFATPVTKNLFKNVNVEFLKKRKPAYILSAVLLAVSLGSLFTNGLDQGVDFVGGRTYQVRFAQEVNPTEVANALSDVFGSAEAKTFGTVNQLKITTKYKVNETGTEVDEEMRESLYNALQPHFNGVSYEDFISDDTNKEVGLMKYYKVSPTIADDIKQSSFWAVIGSLVVVFLYILFRFRRWQFSLGAVA